MYRNIYVETEVSQHSRVTDILRRFPDAQVTHCERYGEIFNRKSQDFRLQKKQPSLILARKHDGFIQPAPRGYGVGGTHNYYFSALLNCLYDCRYCFLQGMYRSASHVVFVNYEDFSKQLYETAKKFNENEQVWFFSGYDCDSLALEPIAGMAQYFMSAVQSRRNLWLELRTKSTQIRSLIGRTPLDNIVTAFSFTPAQISQRLEPRVPNVQKRLAAMLRLQEHGWKIGLRFDPLIFTHDYRKQYRELFDSLFSSLNPSLIHSVSFGVFRLPKDFYKNLERLYPDDEFIAQPFATRGDQISYPVEIEKQMKNWCLSELKKHIEAEKIFNAEIETPQSCANSSKNSEWNAPAATSVMTRVSDSV